MSAQSYSTGAVVLHVRGEVDSATAPFLKQQVAAVIGSAPGVLLDLGEVSFLSSAGLAALISARDAATSTGTGFQLACGDSRPVRRALQVTGTLEMFDVVDRTPEPADALSTPIFPSLTLANRPEALGVW